MDHKTAMQAAQLRLMLAGNHASIVTSVLLATILAYMQYEVIASAVVISWLSLIVLVALIRVALAMGFQRSAATGDDGVHARLVKFRTGVVAAGLIWGSAGFMLYPADDAQHQMFLVFMLAGLTAGGVVSYSADLVSAAGFSVSAMTPLIVRLFIADNSLSFAMGMSAQLYLGFIFITLRYINSSISENIVLRLEASAREEEMKENEERYRLLLTHSPVGILHYDTGLIITYCNARLADILHNTTEHIIGQDMKLIKDQAVLPALTMALAGEKGYYEGRYSATFSVSDGWIAMTCAPSRNGRGEITGGIAIVQDITERKQAENALVESESRFRQMFEKHSSVMLLIDPQSGLIVDANPAAAEFYGYPLQQLRGMPINRINTLSDAEIFQLRQQALHERHNTFVFDHRLANGNIRAVEVHSSPMQFNDKPLLFSIIYDITERKQIENELRIAASAFESQEGMLITDAKSKILRVNKAFSTITGYESAEVLGQTPRILSSGKHDRDFYSAMWERIHHTGAWRGEIWNRRKNGEVYPEYLAITALKDQDGNVTNYVASLADITQQKAAQEEIKNLAFYDPLTRLPNRRLLLDRLQQAMASSARSSNKAALLFIDLDNFKALNDTLGHDIGDLLLQQVAQKLVACVREDDTVARLGGDEFVVMLENLSEHALEAAAQTESIGEKIIAVLNQPYTLGVHHYKGTPSIGATLFSKHELEIDDLFKQADIAMYQAKKAGRNTLRFFDPQMQETINTRVTLESELRKTIENRQFDLYYQIQMDDKRRPLGAEALIRWIHPEHGPVSPIQFIPLAEETGLILPIGKWVLETACAQLKAWEQDELTRDLVLSVNVSAKQFLMADFAAQVQSAIQLHGIKPALLKLELTESMLHDNIEDTIASMNVLKKIGVQFSLDDFGTGYSSLQYLKRLPLDQLKIDQSFVRDIVTDESDRAIVRTIISIAQSLNLDVIAEGVETEEQRVILQDKGCTHYQGYLFGKPLPVKQFEAMLRGR